MLSSPGWSTILLRIRSLEETKASDDHRTEESACRRLQGRRPCGAAMPHQTDLELLVDVLREVGATRACKSAGSYDRTRGASATLRWRWKLPLAAMFTDMKAALLLTTVLMVAFGGITL